MDTSICPRIPRTFFEHAHYVALSRVRSIAGLHILDLNEENIRTSQKVEHYLEHMKKERNLQLCFTPLYTTVALYPTSVSVLFQNARSVHAHFKDIKSDRNITEASVIGLAESRLLHSDCNDDYSLPNFRLLRNDQQRHTSSTRPPHGLLMYTKNDVRILEQHVYSTPLFESIYSCVQHNFEPLQIVIAYVSPTCSFQTLLHHLEICLRNIDLDAKLIIAGDFNMNAIAGGQNYNARLEKHMFENYNCSQLISQSTTDYNNVLDLIFSNCPTHASSVIDSYWSDHKIVYTVLS